MQTKVLNQELDVSEAQKVQQMKSIEQMKQHNSKLRDSLKMLVDRIRQRRDMHRDLTQDSSLLENYEKLMVESAHINMDPTYELPPCNI